MKQLRTAVIGVGLIGTRHAQLIAGHDRCALAAICDADPSRRAIADRFGVPFYTSAEELLEREQPSGAIIATPNAQHASVAEVCAQGGVHLLIEKPIADSMQAAQRIIQATDRAGVRVLVGYHRRHNPLVLKTRALVREGVLGRLVGVSVLWALTKPDDYFQVGWRSQQPGGGPTLINLVHDLDTLRFVCGEITEVYAQMRSDVRGFPVEDSLSISLTFASGALGTVLASDAAAAPWSYEATTGENPHYFHTDENCYHFLGTAGSLAFPALELWRYPDPARRGWQHPLERVRVAVEPWDPLQAQLDHFCRVVAGEEEPLLDAADGARSLAVALAVQESARTGELIRSESVQWDSRPFL